jgi:hypothetical protein
MVALDYFQRLGHDNHRRLSKLYAWEEKKSKASWKAQIVDYEKIAAAAVQGMNTADLSPRKSALWTVRTEFEAPVVVLVPLV